MTQWAFQSAVESLESQLFIQRTVSIIMIIFDNDIEDDDDDVCNQNVIGFDAVSVLVYPREQCNV